MILYKILYKGKSCHVSDMKWSLPKGNKPGRWHEYSGDLKLCRAGFHLTDDPLKWYKPGADYYEAEYDGEILWDENKSKCCVRKVRLIRLVPHNKIWRELDTFITKDIKKVKYFKPDGKPLKEWKIFYGGTWAEALDAAGDAAWDASGESYVKLTQDLPFKDKKKHIAHLSSRWEVWQKGYGLLCDVNGVLYVYCKGNPPKK